MNHANDGSFFASLVLLNLRPPLPLAKSLGPRPSRATSRAMDKQSLRSWMMGEEEDRKLKTGRLWSCLLMPQNLWPRTSQETHFAQGQKTRAKNPSKPWTMEEPFRRTSYLWLRLFLYFSNTYRSGIV